MARLSQGATYPVTALVATLIVYSLAKPQNLDHFTPDFPQMNSAPDHGPNDGHDHKASLQSAYLDSKQEDIPLSLTAFSGLGEDYRKGSDDAKIIIHKFSDFQCPACSGTAKSLRMLHEEFGDKVMIVYRNYPLDQACNPNMSNSLHKEACLAAILGRCAGQIKQFWSFHDRVFKDQDDISERNLISWAKEVGLSDPAIKECRESKDILAKIQEDIKIGDRIGVQGTPSLFVNGRRYEGDRSYEGMRNLIRSMTQGG